MRKILRVILPVAVAVILSCWALYRTDWFTVAKTTSSLPYHSRWETKALSSDELDATIAILRQPFYYLGKGRQSFVFASNDGKYVLKLFNHYRYRYPKIMEIFPLPSFLHSIRAGKLAKKRDKLFYYFGSYRIAFDHLKDESALVCVHLNRTNNIFPHATVYNRSGYPFDIDLNAMAFVVQKKAQPIYPSLLKMIHEGKGFLAVDSFLEVLFARVQQNIADGDIDIGINYGFIEERAICFDVGRLYFDENLRTKELFLQEVLQSSRQLQRWLQSRFPEGKAYFDRQVQHRVDLLFH